jgi:dihydrofolate synthase/folylpolyglutamate synthase
MLICTFKQAEAYLALHIPKNTEQKFPGQLGLDRTRYFLQLLDKPQNKLKVIHITGTSGKGSTAYLISSLLISQGFKVGLHLSPHLVDVRERFQINNRIISKEEFVFYLNKIIPTIDMVGRTFYGPLSYFEILVGLAFYIFNDKKVDYAVIETGMGGWYDGTNVVDREDKLAVLTKIGLDHTEILGKTIDEIAFQKAMIINENSQVISIYQAASAKKVIEQVAQKKQARVFFIRPLSIDFSLNLIGDYQRENAGLALTAITFLSKRDNFILNKNKVRQVFETASFPGRFEIKNIKGKTVVFDAAHNPQKMKAFIGALKKWTKNLPSSGRKFNFLIAFKKGKDYKKMLKIITPLAKSITITSFFTDNQDLIHLSEKPIKIGEELKKLDFFDFQIKPVPKEALEFLLKQKGLMVITGSLYFIGEIYRLIN